MNLAQDSSAPDRNSWGLETPIRTKQQRSRAKTHKNPSHSETNLARRRAGLSHVNLAHSHMNSSQSRANSPRFRAGFSRSRTWIPNARAPISRASSQDSRAVARESRTLAHAFRTPAQQFCAHPCKILAQSQMNLARSRKIPSHPAGILGIRRRIFRPTNAGVAHKRTGIPHTRTPILRASAQDSRTLNICSPGAKRERKPSRNASNMLKPSSASAPNAEK